MKKIISIFLLIAMTFSLCSCFGGGKNTTELNLYFKNFVVYYQKCLLLILKYVIMKYIGIYNLIFKEIYG